MVRRKKKAEREPHYSDIETHRIGFSKPKASGFKESKEYTKYKKKFYGGKSK